MSNMYIATVLAIYDKRLVANYLQYVIFDRATGTGSCNDY